MGRLSISQKIKKARSPERVRDIAQEWAEEWQAEYEKHVRNLEKAIRENDYDLMCRTTGWLKADNEKRFGALPRVMGALLETNAATPGGLEE